MNQLGIYICCLLSRTYFLAINDFPYTQLSKEAKSSLKARTLNSISFVGDIFKQSGITIQPVIVTSFSYGEISSSDGIEIINSNSQISLNPDIFEIFINHLKVKTNKQPPSVDFGFLKRDVKLIEKSFQCSVTTGSHSVDQNSISFDTLTYSRLGVEAMALKLVHELLHDLGFTETEVLSMQKEIYNQLKVDILNYVDSQLFPLLINSATSHFKLANLLFSNFSTHYETLLDIASKAFDAGFPISPNVISDISLEHPFTGNIVQVTLF